MAGEGAACWSCSPWRRGERRVIILGKVLGKIIGKTYFKKIGLCLCRYSSLADDLGKGGGELWGVGPVLQPVGRISPRYPQRGGDARSTGTKPPVVTEEAEDGERRAVYWSLFKILFFLLK